MQFSLKYKKSHGVPVTVAVHEIIARGNKARDRQDWGEARVAYQDALKADPSLAHIWIQLGNVSKEYGEIVASEAAYRRAAELKPGNAEAYLQLGHLHHRAGNPTAAGQHYLRAFKADPTNADAASRLHRMIAWSSGESRLSMIELLKAATAEDHDENAADGPADEPVPGGASLVFDASDLISFYSNARLPTGIQRVQIEAINNALRSPERTVRICCFIEGRDDWLEVPVKLFRSLTELSVKSGNRNDTEWMTALNTLHLRLTLAEPFVFPYGAYLINLGTSWWLQNYFLFVRNAKVKYGIRYVPFVHDFIPIMMPEHCTKELTRDFISWALGVFAHADHYLVNSEATRTDLHRVASILGHAVEPDNIAVIRLDADFRKPGLKSLPRAALTKWLPDGEPFVLLVSTVESRKGHSVAMDAWLELIRRHGPNKIPKLVCVGNRGWLNGEVYRRLEQNELLAKRVVMLSGLSDEELSLLYRSCLFTIYPSLYEGWGLPITESLCYGKPVIASNTTSLPEAGGEFAVYVEPGSPLQWADAVQRMSFDAAYRDGLADSIKAGFRPRTWQGIAAQIDSELMRLAARDGDDAQSLAPAAALGVYHPVTRNRALRIWPGSGSGEVFRVGTGWRWPAIEGCWTYPRGGELAIGLPHQHGPLRVGVLLLGAPEHDVEWRLQIKHRAGLSGTLRKGDSKWATFDYAAADDGDVLRLRLRGDRIQTGDELANDDWTSIGVAGFFIHAQGDTAGSIRLLEAIALGNLEDVNAYCEPLSQSHGSSAEWDALEFGDSDPMPIMSGRP
jgi:glycosyltransferase involved in cell wall biosynthesis